MLEYAVLVMILFPVAYVTHYYKLDGLKQHKFILSQFRKPQIQNQYHWPKIKVLARPLCL